MSPVIQCSPVNWRWYCYLEFFKICTNIFPRLRKCWVGFHIWFYLYCYFHALTYWEIKLFGCTCKYNKSEGPELFSGKRSSDASDSESRYDTKTFIQKYSCDVSAGEILVVCCSCCFSERGQANSTSISLATDSEIRRLLWIIVWRSPDEIETFASNMRYVWCWMQVQVFMLRMAGDRLELGICFSLQASELPRFVLPSRNISRSLDLLVSSCRNYNLTELR